MSKVKWAFAGIVVLQVSLMVFRVDSWPFTSYPMFSQAKVAAETESIQVQVERTDGQIVALPTTGNKRIEFLYNELANAGKTQDLENQLRRDGETYLGRADALSRADIRKFRLVRLKLASSKPLKTTETVLAEVTL